ncbi:glycosyltransferase family 4 protein [Streptomyces yunnanensis]|uniref:Glycosyltransferase involved in cell wall bisynthesis n=1 Tax=Streptomyces yunnanensis TaxID=156453 RepID=A0A9X8QMX4_9ACTN|nr:glycosyltransferase family 4 protein [Streptomyces yunnanensis]SHK82052.1 Glycosyltransferase involved in cell wall bisynthesis [Streptomyces yunnanensis]
MPPQDPPSQERLTVLHVSQPVDGGIARVVAGLVRSQVTAGLRVVVAAPPGGTLHVEAAVAGAEVVLWPARGALGTALSASARLARLVRRTGPHLVHTHGARAGYAVRRAVRGRIPTVHQPHCWPFEDGGPAGRTARVWERYAARWTHRMLCVSEAQRARGTAVGVTGRWVVIPNGVDLRRFAPADDDGRATLRTSLPALRDAVPAGAPLVVCVAQLFPQKGLPTLLRAWPQVTAAVPDARLALVGDGPDRAALHRAAPPGVLFTGAADSVAPWYQAADLVVVPSRWEGMALVPLEAMACGRAVVLSDVGGARECLPADAADGCLVPPGDPAALARAVITLLADPERRTALGERLRDHVRMAHDGQRAAGAVLNLYRELLAVPPVLTVPRAER